MSLSNVLNEEAVGWSNKILQRQCPNCAKTKTTQFVQTQKKVKIGRFKVINLGPREFGAECKNCHRVSRLNKTEVRESRKFDYYFKRPTKVNVNDKSPLTRNVKFPVLTLEKRNKIRSENKKEGLISSAIGIFIAIVLSNWFNWAILIVYISILFGIYAALEDPEMKYRADIEKAKPMHSPKTKTKRSLK